MHKKQLFRISFAIYLIVGLLSPVSMFAQAAPSSPPVGFWGRLGDFITGVFVSVPSVDVKVNGSDVPFTAQPKGSFSVEWESDKVKDCRMNYWGLLPTNISASAESQGGEPVSWFGDPDGGSRTYVAPNEEGVMEFELVCKKEIDGFAISDRVHVDINTLTAGTAGGITPPTTTSSRGFFGRLGDRIGGLLGGRVIPPTAPGRIRWDLSVLALDGIDQNASVAIPLQEAIAFVGQYSEFDVTYSLTASALPHTYAKYDCSEGVQKCVVVNAQDINSAVISGLPVADSYGMFWKASGQPPLQAGSTWGVANGILKGGLKRPYFSIPTDMWWYNNQPFEGFQSRAAQIVAHELINSINAKLEVAPYFCAPLTGTSGDPASKYESDRLKKLTEDCYAKYRAANPSSVSVSTTTQSTPPPPPSGGTFSRLRDVITGVFVTLPSVDLKVKDSEGPVQVSPGDWFRVSWQSSKVKDCRMNYWGLLPKDLSASAKNQGGEPVSYFGNPDGGSRDYQAPNEEGVMEFEFVCRKETDGFAISDRVRVDIGALTAGTAGGITPPPATPGESSSRVIPLIPQTPSAICQDKNAANFGKLLPCMYSPRPTPPIIPPAVPGVKESSSVTPLVSDIAIPSLLDNVLGLGKTYTIAWRYQRGGEVQAPVVYLYLIGEGTNPSTGKTIKTYKYISSVAPSAKAFSWFVPKDFARPTESCCSLTYRIGIGLRSDMADPGIISTSNPISVPVPSPLVVPKVIEPVAPPVIPAPKTIEPTVSPTKIVPPTLITPKTIEPSPSPTTVSEPIKILPPTVDLKVNKSDGPISLAYNTAATLSWSSANAVSCVASGAWSGARAVSGSESTGALMTSKVYILTCSGKSSSVSDSVAVNVQAPIKSRLNYIGDELRQIANILGQLFGIIEKPYAFIE